jgi:hypothetical protein
MRLVGTHSKPVNGVVMNGHASSLEPFAIPAGLQVRQGGPIAPWPQPAKPDKWQSVKSAFRVIFVRRGWLAAIPVILVNSVAFGAQLGFWRVHVPLVFEAVLVALALESIAIYLAWHAHLAQLADDSALRLRLAAYGMALLIGSLNYSHFCGPDWRPTVEAVTFGMMSAISPWLWSVHSRRVSRDALKVKGLIEPHAVRLGATRWFWHPRPCVRVMSRATWVGENDPAKAIALLPGDGQDDGSVVDKDKPADVDKHADKPVVKPQVKPAPRKRTASVSALDKAAAGIKADPGLSDAAVGRKVGVSAKTVQRARSKT